MKSALGDAAVAGWGRVPGSHETWLVIFTKLIQIQLLCQCLVCDHFVQYPKNTAVSPLLASGQCLPCDHFAKRPENTTASHHLLWACKSPRTAQEWLQHRFWIIVHHQNLSGPSRAVYCCQRSRCLVEWGQPPRHPECPQQCSSRLAR